MYIGICFVVLLVAIMFSWLGKRDGALITFSISLIMAVGTLWHHMTSVLGLSL